MPLVVLLVVMLQIIEGKMKSLSDFKKQPGLVLEEERTDYSKFDMLVRAGLANKAQLQRIHKILDKMQEERPQFNNADRLILQNLFNKMVDLLTSNKQIFQKTRQAVREETEDSSIQITEEAIQGDPPFVLVLKRKAFRLYPNGLKVAVYYNDKLGKFFSVPYFTDKNMDNPIQAEENILDLLNQIVEHKQVGIFEMQNNDVVEIDVEEAKNILNLLDALNESNKEKALMILDESAEQFNMLTSFAKEKAK